MKSRMRRSKVVASAEMYRGFAISVVGESFEDIRVVCSQAADEMLNITGVDASVTVYPIENWLEFQRAFAGQGQRAGSHGEYRKQKGRRRRTSHNGRRTALQY